MAALIVRAISFLLVPAGGFQVVTIQFLLPFGQASIALAVDAKDKEATPNEARFKTSRREDPTPYAFTEAKHAAKRMNDTVVLMLKLLCCKGKQLRKIQMRGAGDGLIQKTIKQKRNESSSSW
jgi:hypothetical protein